MNFLYNISIRLYYFAIFIASFFNKKAKVWIKGRKNQNLKSQFLNLNSEVYWFHCASLGEFEQGRPLIEKLKMNNEKLKIVLTFFSPSGYEVRKNYEFADLICYLPLDTPVNAKEFIEAINPTKVFFVKYEFWHNYLVELKKKNIPTYLVSGIFREEQRFFKSYGAWFRKSLSCFTHFFVQNEKSKELLNQIKFSNVTVSGDTRFDRVLQIAEKSKSFPIVDEFCKNSFVIVAGSTWQEDEKLISNLKLQTSNLKLIIAPHEISENHIQSITQLFNNSKVVRFSQAKIENISSANILMIDNIGMLSSLYKYASIAYVGGGFGKGIHNVLEAAVFGVPVVFGTNYQKFEEAKELIKSGGGFSVSNSDEFQKLIQKFSQKEELTKSGKVAFDYVKSKAGATEKIIQSV